MVRDGRDKTKDGQRLSEPAPENIGGKSLKLQARQDRSGYCSDCISSPSLQPRTWTSPHHAELSDVSEDHKRE